LEVAALFFSGILLGVVYFGNDKPSGCAPAGFMPQPVAQIAPDYGAILIITNCDDVKLPGNRSDKYLSYAFTEQGGHAERQ